MRPPTGGGSSALRASMGPGLQLAEPTAFGNTDPRCGPGIGAFFCCGTGNKVAPEHVAIEQTPVLRRRGEEDPLLERDGSLVGSRRLSCEEIAKVTLVSPTGVLLVFFIFLIGLLFFGTFCIGPYYVYTWIWIRLRPLDPAEGVDVCGMKGFGPWVWETLWEQRFDKEHFDSASLFGTRYRVKRLPKNSATITVRSGCREPMCGIFIPSPQQDTWLRSNGPAFMTKSGKRLVAPSDVPKICRSILKNDTAFDIGITAQCSTWCRREVSSRPWWEIALAPGCRTLGSGPYAVRNGTDLAGIMTVAGEVAAACGKASTAQAFHWMNPTQRRYSPLLIGALYWLCGLLLSFVMEYIADVRDGKKDEFPDSARRAAIMPLPTGESKGVVPPDPTCFRPLGPFGFGPGKLMQFVFKNDAQAATWVLRLKSLLITTEPLFDVASIVTYLKAGQPSYALFTAISIISTGDPLQWEGHMHFRKAYRRGYDGEDSLRHSVVEGLREGPVTIFIALLAFLTSPANGLGPVTLTIRLCTILPAIFVTMPLAVATRHVLWLADQGKLSADDFYAVAKTRKDVKQVIRHVPGVLLCNAALIAALGHFGGRPVFVGIAAVALLLGTYPLSKGGYTARSITRFSRWCIDILSLMNMAMVAGVLKVLVFKMPAVTWPLNIFSEGRACTKIRAIYAPGASPYAYVIVAIYGFLALVAFLSIPYTTFVMRELLLQERELPEAGRE